MLRSWLLSSALPYVQTDVACLTKLQSPSQGSFNIKRILTRTGRLRKQFWRQQMSMRPVKSVTESQAVMEGAGVHLRRAFGFGKTEDFDPFLLLDDFRNDNPADYLAGFPWHPHRGIETITYVLAGSVEHGDSIGNRGSIDAGDVQWMTAGRGIMHQEMPRGDGEGRMHGFQLWANLPAHLKMTEPRYQEIKAADIPVVTDDDGTSVRLVTGSFWGRRGPVEGIAADPVYLDVSVPSGRTKRLPVGLDSHAFAYVFAGSGQFRAASPPQGVMTERVKLISAPVGAELAPPSIVVAAEGGASSTPTGSLGFLDDDVVLTPAGDRSLVLFDRGDEVVVQAGEQGIRFLLVSGRPLQEPVAWHGPIVMNTPRELQTAFEQLRDGTFLKQ
jgi:redox-sensitive bicupin YhaK (pirin superfamily)